MSVRWLRQLRCIVGGLAALACAGGECMGRPENANDPAAAAMPIAHERLAGSTCRPITP